LFNYLKAYNAKTDVEKEEEPLAVYMKRVLDELAPGKRIE